VISTTNKARVQVRGKKQYIVCAVLEAETFALETNKVHCENLERPNSGRSANHIFDLVIKGCHTNKRRDLLCGHCE
jgi:hypothetical protein